MNYAKKLDTAVSTVCAILSAANVEFSLEDASTSTQKGAQEILAEFDHLQSEMYQTAEELSQSHFNISALIMKLYWDLAAITQLAISNSSDLAHQIAVVVDETSSTSPFKGMAMLGNSVILSDLEKKYYDKYLKKVKALAKGITVVIPGVLIHTAEHDYNLLADENGRIHYYCDEVEYSNVHDMMFR